VGLYSRLAARIGGKLGIINQYANPKSRPFLLMEGGPLYRIENRIGLIKARAPIMVRRALIAAALTWVPLLILSVAEGTAYGSNIPVPFLRDFGTYSRFLVDLPLLLLAEIVIGPRIAGTAEHFVTSGVVVQKDFDAFDVAVAKNLRLRDSVLAEVIILILSYIATFIAFRTTAVHVSTWYATQTGTGLSITLPGWWLILFCAPLLNFLLLRWLWRIFLWFRFLSMVCKLDLQLFPTHPDGAGGLGFVGAAQRFFGILVFAYSFGGAGVIANDLVYDKVPLQNYAPAFAIYAACVLLVLILPLAIFTPKLLATKRKGLQQYGTLATAYTGAFQNKWVVGKNPQNDALLGTRDIQSLADLANSYALIKKMNPLPVDLRSMLHLVIAALLPMAPLLLAVMPLKDLLKLLFKVLA
jgi:hypothetical protein